MLWLYPFPSSTIFASTRLFLPSFPGTLLNHPLVVLVELDQPVVQNVHNGIGVVPIVDDHHSNCYW
jgi:hypothetical protein